MVYDEDSNLIEKLYIENYEKLYDIACFYLIEKEDAKDMIQEVFTIILKNKENIYKISDKIDYIYRVLSFCLERKRYDDEQNGVKKYNKEDIIKVVKYDDMQLENLLYF